MYNMRKSALLHVLIISFVFLLTPTVQAASYAGEIETYKQEVEKNPDDAEAHFNLGVAYLLLNDRGSALEQYEILKSLDSELANVLFNLIGE